MAKPSDKLDLSDIDDDSYSTRDEQSISVLNLWNGIYRVPVKITDQLTEVVF